MDKQLDEQIQQIADTFMHLPPNIFECAFDTGVDRVPKVKLSKDVTDPSYIRAILAHAPGNIFRQFEIDRDNIDIYIQLGKALESIRMYFH